MSDPKAVSIRQRLLNRARETKEDYNELLARYVGLRFLVRLAASAHRDQFLLKGATLFLVWQGKTHRPTRDVDLLGLGVEGESELETVIKEVCVQPVEPDGIVFDPDRVSFDFIRDDNPYGGIRFIICAQIGSARQKLQIDIGLGDSVDPPPVIIDIPRLLPDEAPWTMRAYRPETSIAEKFEAMISLGLANSRMKDFFDIEYLARSMNFEGSALVDAVRSTLRRRRTEVPSAAPVALTEAFWTDPMVANRWTTFLRKNSLPPQSLKGACERIRAFLEPVWTAVKHAESFESTWADGAWRERRVRD